MVTEWILQEELTEDWYRSGGVETGQESLFLAAWEVMDDWRINDAHRHWSRPSIDFLFLDAAGGLVAGELKRTITAPRECWSALCQVTHRAHLLARSFSVDRLESVYRDCLSGKHGRPHQSAAKSLVAGWHDYFGSGACEHPIGSGPVRRIVLAAEFGPSWSSILERFNSQDAHTTASHLRREYQVFSKSNRELSRFAVLAAEGTSLGVAGNVTGLRICRPI